MGRCPGIMVKADDSRSKVPVFDSRHFIFDGCHDFSPNVTCLSMCDKWSMRVSKNAKNALSHFFAKNCILTRFMRKIASSITMLARFIIAICVFSKINRTSIVIEIAIFRIKPHLRFFTQCDVPDSKRSMGGR